MAEPLKVRRELHAVSDVNDTERANAENNREDEHQNLSPLDESQVENQEAQADAAERAEDPDESVEAKGTEDDE
jgi:hypothetical protein